MREADVAIRMHPPRQPDLIQRHLMEIEWIVCAAPEYLAKHGTPKTVDDLDNHRLVLFGNYRAPVEEINWLADAGRRPGSPRRPVLEVNNLASMARPSKPASASAPCPAGWATNSTASPACCQTFRVRK